MVAVDTSCILYNFSFRTNNNQIVFLSKYFISGDELAWIEPPLKITSISIEGCIRSIESSESFGPDAITIILIAKAYIIISYACTSNAFVDVSSAYKLY